MSNTKNLANLASVLDDGSSGQVLQSTGSGGVAFADAGGTGVTVHSNQTQMLDAAASATEGSLHYDTGANKLYVKQSSGFFLLATITNTTPTITSFSENTGGAGANNLTTGQTFGLTSGSNTVITINATDPDLETLVYSATVTSGTASDVISSPSLPISNQSGNTFTLVPATSGGGGSITVRFDVSDGSNIANVTQSFEITFSITDSNFTRLLMATDNAVGGNQSITDSSSNSYSLTVSGDSHAGSFSPYRHSGYSTHFNGSTDYLTIADNAEHDFGTGEFSIEFFWKPETLTGNSASIHIPISCPNDGSTQLIYNESTYWYFQGGSAGAIVLNSSGTGAASVGQWNHVVLCRTGTTLSIFHNGTRVATTTSSYDADFSNATIGRYHSSSANYYIDGLVKDMRWLKGSSAYDATQSSITVPTEALTAVTNTKLLLFHTPYLADGSSTGHTITLSGSTHTRPSSPYDSAEYSEASNGGSISFDGTGDYLTVGSTDPVNFGANNFTISMWLYPTNGGAQEEILNWRAADGVSNTNFTIHRNSSNELRTYIGNGSSYFVSNANLGTLVTNVWNHVVISRNGNGTSGTELKSFINGVTTGTASMSGTVGSTAHPVHIGRDPANSAYNFTGFIADLTIDKGTATTSVTVPTSLQSSTGLDLHVKGTAAHVLDKSQAGQIKLFGNAASASLAHSGFDSHSLRLQGSTSNHARHDASIRLDGRFTIEAWFNATAFDGYLWCIGQYLAELKIENNQARFYAGGYSDFAYGSTLSTGTWYHIALCRNSSNLIQVWLNGTRLSSSYTKTTTYSADYTIIGGEAGAADGSTANYVFNGYIQDLRITAGKDRYTAADESSNIPSSALKG